MTTSATLAAPWARQQHEVLVQRRNFLEALDGVAYVVSKAGMIMAIGATAWDAFASRNGWEDGRTEKIVGRDLFSMFSGPQLRASAASLHRSAANGRKKISYAFRCDAPDRKRYMRMSISPISDASGEVTVLYQSQLLSETERPWINLFDPQVTDRYLAGNKILPTVSLCSYCQKVAWRPPGMRSDLEWIEAEEYYARGGSGDVVLSHGVCGACTDIFEVT